MVRGGKRIGRAGRQIKTQGDKGIEEANTSRGAGYIVATSGVIRDIGTG